MLKSSKRYQEGLWKEVNDTLSTEKHHAEHQEQQLRGNIREIILFDIFISSRDNIYT